jgi:hypothetical protein
MSKFNVKIEDLRKAEKAVAGAGGCSIPRCGSYGCPSDSKTPSQPTVG